ncbi:uncharacterized protein LOC130811302 [Amaranthus tricolor]|uniref:uncharacterized protein LOC130811302 n=1 Tax=Amaranthus tricolor TaxID=29722 RepID=UPI002590CF5B|nr:uncharacterized protein LOC130811302 [Amaranthus tricolor]
MNPNTDKLIRRTTMVGTVVAAYFLLTADYGPQPNILDPIKNTILSAERSAKDFIFGNRKAQEDSNKTEKTDTSSTK